MSEYTKEKRTVLVVEDDEINKLLLAEILKEDYNILDADNGRDAIRVLKQNVRTISAILLDIQMPVMNGLEFLKYVSQDSVYSRIPVIVTTVLASVEDEQKCLELGASDFVVKPYNPMLVRLRVANLIRLRECDGIISDLEIDALTGFKTRKAYYNDLEILEEVAKSEVKPIGLAFVDINGLKRINDTYGHKEGDKLIASVAKSITEVFPDAKKYRVGGDEFVILSFDKREEDFKQKIEELKDTWYKDSAALGSVWLENAVNLEQNVARADKKMYEDKNDYYKKRNMNT